MTTSTELKMTKVSFNLHGNDSNHICWFEGAYGLFWGSMFVYKGKMFKKRKDFDFNFMDFKGYSSPRLISRKLYKSDVLMDKYHEGSIEIAGLTFAWNYFSRISTLSSDNQKVLLLQYSRDGYVIEGELKEYEDSCEKSSVQNDNVILEVFHHDVSCDTIVPIVGHGESSDSQDYPSSSMSQLLQVVINEKPGPVVDSTQMVVDNRIDLDDMLGFKNQYEQVAKKGDEGLVQQDDMLVLEEGVNRLDYGKEENDESKKTQEKDQTMFSIEINVVRINEPLSAEMVFDRLLSEIKTTMAIFGPDLQEIPLEPWVEDLSRSDYSRKRKVKAPKYVDMIYNLGDDTTHIFFMVKI
ncbi:hypothetical protein Tco_1384912 [Tanacetum coccineum]